MAKKLYPVYQFFTMLTDKSKIKSNNNFFNSLIIFIFRRMRFFLVILNNVIGYIGFLILLTIFFPLIIYRRFLTHKNNAVFFINLEHIISKTIDRGEWFSERNYDVLYFSHEHTELTDKSTEIVKHTSIVLLDVYLYFFYLIYYNPKYVEIYLQWANLALYQNYFSFLSSLTGSYNSLIFRGETFITSEDDSFTTEFERNGSYRFFLKLAMMSTSTILYRDYINHINFEIMDKATFDPNCVKINNYNLKRHSKNILFLNRFLDFRNVSVLAESVKLVLKKVPKARFYFVGYHTDSERKSVVDILERDDVLDSCEVVEYTSQVSQYFDKCSIFVLLANEHKIFPNYSLLESMERGLVPLLSDVYDSRFYMEKRSEELISKVEKVAVSKSLIKLLADETLWYKFSKKSRNYVKLHYDNSNRMKKLFNLIEGYYSNQQKIYGDN